MKNFNIEQYTVNIICEDNKSDAVVTMQSSHNELSLFLTACKSKPKYIEIKWQFKTDGNPLVLGDAWERSYGDLQFIKLSENDRYMPWYFSVTVNNNTFCLGVKTQPSSFVSFKYTHDGITALFDCRNGGSGVELNGRTLCAGTLIFEKYLNTPVFEALQNFCKKMCDSPILPKERIYGGNNWYYAYGISSYDEIIDDTKIQVELSKGIDNKPFMVIDDCWQINECAGPWLPNCKFKDMKKLTDEIKSLGARPGIWLRLLYNHDEKISDDMKINRNGEKIYLDPTNPKVQRYIISDINRIKSWGFELIKHDFSTVDLFGDYGKDLNSKITNYDNWSFYDKSKTNAEIVLDFYKLIKEASGEMLIIGCNTVSHLCAGLVHINRTGDDTSGKDWERTKKMGINTLAFRLCQNNSFYLVDADCVGILDDNIDWSLNKQWLDLLSKSETALFVSCNSDIPDNIKQDIRNAYKEFDKPHKIKPVNLTDTLTPEKWEIDGKQIKYSWN